jgi:hypothetical protein
MTSQSKITTSLNFRLEIHHALLNVVLLLLEESVNNESMRDDFHTDKSTPTSTWSLLVNKGELLEKSKQAFAFRFNATTLPIEMATIIL